MIGRKKLTDSEFNQLLTYLRSDPNPLNVVFELLLATGMRQSELMHCKVDHVVSQVYVKSCKSSDKRRVKITEELAVKLRRLEWPLYKNFSTSTASHSITRMLRRYWPKVTFKAFGAAPVSLHGLRHTFATRTLEAVGRDVRVVRRLMGHRDMNSTLKYLDDLEMEEFDDALVGALDLKNGNNTKK